MDTTMTSTKHNTQTDNVLRSNKIDHIENGGEGALAVWWRSRPTHSFMNFNSAKSVSYRAHDISFYAPTLAHSEKTSL